MAGNVVVCDRPAVPSSRRCDGVWPEPSPRVRLRHPAIPEVTQPLVTKHGSTGSYRTRLASVLEKIRDNVYPVLFRVERCGNKQRSFCLRKGRVPLLPRKPQRLKSPENSIPAWHRMSSVSATFPAAIRISGARFNRLRGVRREAVWTDYTQ